MHFTINRRNFLVGVGAAAISVPEIPALLAQATREAQPASRESSSASAPELTPELRKVKALVFDTFGTIVDWRSSVIAEGMAWGKAKGLQIDWAQFADRWRLGYRPAMDKVRKGTIPWTRLDDLHRMILEDLLKEYKIQGLTEEEKVHWAYVWRRLKPWPDSPEGLTRLKKKYIIAPLSNGNIALMTNLAKFGGLPWDAILGAELAKHYKPDREVYLSAAYYLDLKPEEIMMCAAHRGDLEAARSLGLRTGFIYRPDEFRNGAAGKPDKAQPGDFDVVSTSATDLAHHLAT